MSSSKLVLVRSLALAFLIAGMMIAAPGNGRGGGKKPPPPPPPPPPDCEVTYDGYSSRIAFSEYVWAVKNHGKSLAGPGPNRFSDSSGSVFVDDDGRLHLKIRKIKGKWHAAEVINLCTLGYGTYRIYLDSEVDAFDPNVVLGIFTWSDLPAEHHRELDIEFSRWSDPNNLNAQYVVQPYDTPGNIFRFSQPPATAQSTQILNWTPGQATFESRIGHGTAETPGPLVSSFPFTQGVPTTEDENFRFNLWMFRGDPPTDGQVQEVIINRFEFEPAP